MTAIDSDNRLAISARPHVATAGAGSVKASVGWQRRVQIAAIVIDAAAAAVTGTAVQLSPLDRSHLLHREYPLALTLLLLPTVWVSSVAWVRGYECRFLGSGFEEFRRVGQAAMNTTALVAFVAYVTNADHGRALLVAALPIVGVTSAAGRYAIRRKLHRLRRAGTCRHRLVLVGHLDQVRELARQLAGEPHHGYDVVGVCLPLAQVASGRRTMSRPTIGSLVDTVAVAEGAKADTVAVLACPELAGTALRRLAWQLEGQRIQLIVAPGLIEVAGPRLHIRPVAGLPLLHVEHPTLSGGRRVIKAVVDLVGATSLLAVSAPLLLAIAVAVKLSSPGPALFRQARIGRNGEPFTLLKFRTMVRDAEAQRAAVASLNDRSEGPLFKARHDPRVTPLGRYLRRYSLDELPQLVNVVTGRMSLVGPRPPLPEEVSRYDGDVSRRLLVKPGLTGLWQVSGRSDLTWEESVRLDLRYVENWSLALDALIMWKTASAVVHSAGAY